MALIMRLPKGFLSKSRSLLTKRSRSTTTTTKCETTVPDPNACKPPKNWVSYGFEFKSESADRFYLHTIFFTSVSLCLIGGGYVFMYLPDFNLRDWSQREAYLELKRREEAGLPHIDKNLVDPRKIKLPTEEEIGDMEIII